jgi:hypothetical protein
LKISRFFLAGVALVPAALRALTVQPMSAALTANDLAQMLAGGGVVVSNVTYQGVSLASGSFSGATTALGINDGVLLTCGSVNNAPGPNSTSSASASNGLPGDPDLSAAAGVSTNDASVLEFDFIPGSSSISFTFVFGSEEYPEFVGSFNDGFGIFVNGVNVALVPGAGVPVTINNVSPLTNSSWYVDNSSGLYNTQLDGFTKPIPVSAAVNPGVVNHIKFAVADALDYSLDTMVFIQAGSLTAFTPTPTITKSFTPGPTPTISPTFTRSQTFTPSPTLTPSPTATVTQSSTISPTFSISQTFTVSPTVTPTPTITPTYTETPLPLLLTPKYPNPNPGVTQMWLPYVLSTGAEVDIKVFDVAGELVRSFDPQTRSEGAHEEMWDLKNSFGRKVASGIYLYRIHAVSPRHEEDDAWMKCAVSR